MSFRRNHCVLDRDFQLYIARQADRLGHSLFTQRESPGDAGCFLLVLSPQAEGPALRAPRDLALVVDTSGSMKKEKLRQAKATMANALDSLAAADRFALVGFATAAVSFRPGLLPATPANLEAARHWVQERRAVGGTNLAAALETALSLQDHEKPGRPFQLVLLTDGVPPVGRIESSEVIQIARRYSRQTTRIFTFGVGNDVDAPLLDLLAATTRGTSTFVRAGEDIEQKVAALTAKLRRPARTELQLGASENIKLVDLYPPRLPDLYEGEQLQVAGRYQGHGPATLTLKGRSGAQPFSESFEAEFPAMAAQHDFVAPIWAGRKAGYLLDQIRSSGESDELKQELLQLARDFGIATRYTSLLAVPAPSRSGSGGAPLTGIQQPEPVNPPAESSFTAVGNSLLPAAGTSSRAQPGLRDGEPDHLGQSQRHGAID